MLVTETFTTPIVAAVAAANPIDNFAGQAAFYTEIMNFVAGGAPFYGSIQYTQTTLPPFPLGVTTVLGVSGASRTSNVVLGSDLITYTVVITLKDSSGNAAANFTVLTQTPITPLSSVSVVGISGVSMTVTETLTTPQLSAQGQWSKISFSEE